MYTRGWQALITLNQTEIDDVNKKNYYIKFGAVNQSWKQSEGISETSIRGNGLEIK